MTQGACALGWPVQSFGLRPVIIACCDRVAGAESSKPRRKTGSGPAPVGMRAESLRRGLVDFGAFVVTPAVETESSGVQTGASKTQPRPPLPHYASRSTKYTPGRKPLVPWASVF